MGRDGSISVGEGVETLIGCANAPNDVVTGKARRFTVDRDRLTLLDAQGAVLGRYQRVG